MIIVLVSELLRWRMFQYVFLLVLSFELCNSYVLLQVVKNEKNQSDVKAYVHKVLPAEKEPQQESTTTANPNDDKVRRFEIKTRVEEDENKSLRRTQTVLWINQAFDLLKQLANGPEFRASETMSFIDKALDLAKAYVNGPKFRSSRTMKYLEKIIDIVKDVANESPEYRSGKRAPNMKTEIVHFKGGQPSLVFELRPTFFIELVKKILNAKLVEKYMDDMGISNPDKQGYNRNQKRYPMKPLNKKSQKYSKYITN